MDNDIYNKIADYNEWVHLERPPGGVVEIEKLQGGKMKDEIKEIIKQIENNMKQNVRIDYTDILELIAEIERLENLVADYLYGRSRNMEHLLIKQKKIEELQAVCEAAKELNDVLYSGRTVSVNELQQTRKKFQQTLVAKDKG